ncbi:MAG TPA: hypothetical protein VGE79_13310 [Niastella sp.]
MKAQYISLLLISITLSSCRFSKKETKVNNSGDAFYSDLGGFDRPRIPLIKPYELLKVSGNEWRLELQNPELLTLSIHNVKSVAIQDSLILIYSEGGTEFLNMQHQKAWFVIEPGVGSEKGFSDEKEFNKVVNRLRGGIKNQFHSLDSLYKKFEEHKRIVW